jgi:hypothetical protein
MERHVSKTVPLGSGPEATANPTSHFVPNADPHSGRPTSETRTATLEELAEWFSQALRRGLARTVRQEDRDASVPIGDGTDLMVAAWVVVGHIQEIVSARSGGAVRFVPLAPEPPMDPWTADETARRTDAGRRRFEKARAALRALSSLEHVTRIELDPPSLSRFLATPGAERPLLKHLENGLSPTELIANGAPALLVRTVLSELVERAIVTGIYGPNDEDLWALAEGELGARLPLHAELRDAPKGHVHTSALPELSPLEAAIRSLSPPIIREAAEEGAFQQGSASSPRGKHGTADTVTLDLTREIALAAKPESQANTAKGQPAAHAPASFWKADPPVDTPKGQPPHVPASFWKPDPLVDTPKGQPPHVPASFWKPEPGVETTEGQPPGHVPAPRGETSRGPPLKPAPTQSIMPQASGQPDVTRALIAPGGDRKAEFSGEFGVSGVIPTMPSAVSLSSAEFALPLVTRSTAPEPAPMSLPSSCLVSTRVSQTDSAELVESQGDTETPSSANQELEPVRPPNRLRLAVTLIVACLGGLSIFMLVRALSSP